MTGGLVTFLDESVVAPRPLDSRFRGKDGGGCGNDGGGAGKTGRRLCTTESTGDGISTVSRWICYRPGPPAHWVPACAGKTEGGAGKTEGGAGKTEGDAGKTGRRLCTTESTGDGISTVSRWICYRPGPPAHWVPACAGKTEGGAGRRLCTTESTGNGTSPRSERRRLAECSRPGQAEIAPQCVCAVVMVEDAPAL